MKKKRKIISFENLPQEVADYIKTKFPNGYENHVKRIDAPNPFYAIVVDYGDMSYLVKVNVKVDPQGLDIDEIIKDVSEETKSRIKAETVDIEDANVEISDDTTSEDTEESQEQTGEDDNL